MTGPSQCLVGAHGATMSRLCHAYWSHAVLLLFICFHSTCISVVARENGGVFALGIRDSFMIAHSFHNKPAFGPAGGMHGATYTCDVEFGLDNENDLNSETNWVIDIGKASEVLAYVLQKYNFQNLDEIFGEGVLTTTEFMCRQIHSDIKDRLLSECVDFKGTICVKLWESHKAWASYKASI